MSEAEVVQKEIKAGFGVVEKDRKLARIVIIDDVVPHPNAERLELAVIGGWQLCVKLGEYKKGDRAVYCEIDSLLPLSNVELFGFLEERRSDNRRVDGVNFHRLKTIKLRKEISQGLLVPVPAKFKDSPVDTNLTLELGILKYEPRAPMEPSNKEARGSDWYSRLIRKIIGNLDGSLIPWPAQLTKSDQDRVQNKTVAFTLAKEAGEVFEVTYKLDGSSMTVFCINDKGVRTGVCSRNYELGLGEGNWSFSEQLRHWVGAFLIRNRKVVSLKKVPLEEGGFKRKLHWTGIHIPQWLKGSIATENNFTRYVKEHEVTKALREYQARTGEFITVQGELIGPDIQSNFEGVDKHEYHVFSVYRNGNEEVLPEEAEKIVKELGLTYVPIFDRAFVIKPEQGVKEILELAEGQRAFNPKKGTYREGLVFKSKSRLMSFKAISNSYLIKKADE
ncbi:RNA ligase [Pseudomonas phage Psa21]|uniref:Putative RNA ligase n=1 Tax=Pseudomonas phage Psa21 TaxID=2530023 RepID=A0A481W555_9CAUD|nr:RNA ligase [Pseudomonas phage Psa21]QBJ02838.1 putative RNA ligase [Pseudomonas phage Psa21]